MKLQSTLLTFSFAFWNLKNDFKISVLFEQIQIFEVLNLVIVKVQKDNIAVT